MARVSRAFFRLSSFAFAVVAFCLTVLVVHTRDPFEIRGRPLGGFKVPFAKPSKLADAAPPQDVLKRLDLSEEQCRTTFPDLLQDVDRMVARGKFVFGKSDSRYKGLVQGRIKDNNLYILTVSPDIVTQIVHQRTAILQQLHRALLTSPTRIPNTHFAFVVNDNPKNNSWSFSKPNRDIPTQNTWLMPGFQFWSWQGKDADTGIGVFSDVMERIDAVEQEIGSWANKTDKAVWRGTPWFNPISQPRLRQDLIHHTKGKEWADVKPLQPEPQHKIEIEDFCRYKYLLYTEGVTYSGRLPYHQACRSVLVTPRLTHLTSSTSVVKGIDADVLMVAFGGKENRASSPSVSPNVNAQHIPLLRPVSDYRDANAMYVDPSFSNLETVIVFLRKHPDIAERIAQNQRHVAVEQGYLSPAAETCYWRALMRGWASVAVVKTERDSETDRRPENLGAGRKGEGGEYRGEWGDELGERFESWILQEVTGGARRMREQGGHG
ncbi:hypothetical protein K491DRAFT_712006 [Lophiostoma macrostomum CBS 122681]|uniref:Glycosyl transferase CAP10 domain-containing protein n=1 Tax=Lophiostoma macrostomum CBS 122681 TaxID=1314788 RepID=A0A6A6TMR3_9PLEO|nr:hypothetical protein K491DRAFT_712006 [Lophiostoma macrostomum CBS 122681]